MSKIDIGDIKFIVLKEPIGGGLQINYFPVLETCSVRKEGTTQDIRILRESCF
jgi:hypothetical protein